MVKRCKICRKQAIVFTPSGNFCKEHFVEYFIKKIKKTIEKFDMIKENDKILVAVSGGKDSASIAYVLNELGYNFEGLFIDLEIEGFSEICKQKAIELFNVLGKKLNIIKVSDYGVKVRPILNRPVCSICGTIKRYLINKFAYENGFSVVVTGHNLNDEIAFHFLNLYSGSLEYFIKQYPIIPESTKLVRKVKPLYFLSEKEIKLFAKINNLPICEVKCPYSKENNQNKLKKALKNLDKEFKFFNYNVLNSLIKLKKKYLRSYIYDQEINKFCKICGYPTASKDEVCLFCKIRNYYKNVELSNRNKFS